MRNIEKLRKAALLWFERRLPPHKGPILKARLRSHPAVPGVPGHSVVMWCAQALRIFRTQRTRLYCFRCFRKRSQGLVDDVSDGEALHIPLRFAGDPKRCVLQAGSLLSRRAFFFSPDLSTSNSWSHTREFQLVVSCCRHVGRGVWATNLEAPRSCTFSTGRSGSVVSSSSTKSMESLRATQDLDGLSPMQTQPRRPKTFPVGIERGLASPRQLKRARTLLLVQLGCYVSASSV